MKCGKIRKGREKRMGEEEDSRISPEQQGAIQLVMDQQKEKRTLRIHTS